MTRCLLVVGVLATSCAKADEPSGAAPPRETTEAAGSTEPQVAKEPTPPPITDRLSAFATRARAASRSSTEIDAMLKEGEALIAEARQSGGDPIFSAPAFKDAMAQIVVLAQTRNVLRCADATSANDVSSCFDDLVLTTLRSTWKDFARLCTQALQLGLQGASDVIVANEACRAVTPSFDEQLELLLDSSPALAAANRAAWTKQRKKAIATSWSEFGKLDEVRAYWRAVADVLHEYCASVEDGDLDVSAVFLVDAFLTALGGDAALNRLPSTSYKLLVKDRDAEKGKVLKVRAQVLTISKDGPFYRGQLMDSSYRSYMFVTSGSTDGIFEDAYVTLRGVVTQIEHFETRSGGTNAAPVVIGYLRK